jgi:hypothetical protein
MLIAPMALAAGAAGHLGMPGLICVVAALAAFCARSPALSLLRVRGRARSEAPASHDAFLAAGYLLIAAASGSALIVGWERWTLVWFAAATLVGVGAYTVAYWWRWDQAIGWQVVFAVALTQTGPALYVAEVGRLQAEAVSLWILAAAYFSARLLVVHGRVRELKEHRALTAERWKQVGVDGLITAGAAVAGALRLAPPLVAIALLPALVRAAYLALVPRYSRTTLKAIGREELWMAVAFTALGLVAFLFVPPGWYGAR